MHAGACVPSQVFPPPGALEAPPAPHRRRRPPAPRPRQKINVPCNPCIMHSRFVLARPEPGENERTAPVKFTRAATRAHLNVVRPCAPAGREGASSRGWRRPPPACALPSRRHRNSSLKIIKLHRPPRAHTRSRASSTLARAIDSSTAARPPFHLAPLFCENSAKIYVCTPPTPF